MKQVCKRLRSPCCPGNALLLSAWFDGSLLRESGQAAFGWWRVVAVQWTSDRTLSHLCRCERICAVLAVQLCCLLIASIVACSPSGGQLGWYWMVWERL